MLPLILPVAPAEVTSDKEFEPLILSSHPALTDKSVPVLLPILKVVDTADACSVILVEEPLT